MFRETIRQQIDKEANLGWQMTAVGIDGINSELDRIHVRHHPDKPPRSEIVEDNEARRQKHAPPCHRQVSERLGAV